jgi:hypothetical protein
MAPAILFVVLLAIVAMAVGTWIALIAFLATLSGWGRLTAMFPDRPEPSLLTLRGQQGMIGRVTYRGALVLSACPSGMRVSMSKISGPFLKPFFVPWGSLSAAPVTKAFEVWAELRFDGYSDGRLYVGANSWERLRRMAPRPDRLNATAVTDAEILRGLVTQGAIVIGFISLFFFAVSALGRPKPDLIGMLLVYLIFCAMLGGMLTLEFFRRRLPKRG